MKPSFYRCMHNQQHDLEGEPGWTEDTTKRLVMQMGILVLSGMTQQSAFDYLANVYSLTIGEGLVLLTEWKKVLRGEYLQ